MHKNLVMNIFTDSAIILNTHVLLSNNFTHITLTFTLCLSNDVWLFTQYSIFCLCNLRSNRRSYIIVKRRCYNDALVT